MAPELVSPELVGDGVADYAQRIGPQQQHALDAAQPRLAMVRVRVRVRVWIRVGAGARARLRGGGGGWGRGRVRVRVRRSFALRWSPGRHVCAVARRSSVKKTSRLPPWLGSGLGLV